MTNDKNTSKNLDYETKTNDKNLTQLESKL